MLTIGSRLYTGPAVPTTYDPMWSAFTNLTPAQVLAFQTFPQDLSRYAMTRRWLTENTTLPVTITITISGTPVTLQVDMSDRGQARVDKLARKWGAGNKVIAFLDTTGTVFQIGKQAIGAIDDAVTNYVELLHTTLGTLLAGINVAPPTVTTRAQIDAAYAAIAPNSPSGTNPSPN